MRRLAIAVLGFAAIVACDSNKVTVDLSADAGNYVLRSLNDTVLPYTYTQDSVLTILITADTIFMGVDGHFLDRTHYLRIQSGVTDFAHRLDGWFVDGRRRHGHLHRRILGVHVHGGFRGQLVGHGGRRTQGHVHQIERERGIAALS